MMLDIVKTSMRIAHNKLDEDIQRNISACLLDLERVGVSTSAETDLLMKACELYCKWQYDYQGKAEQYRTHYERLRDAMSLCSDYRAGDSFV